MLFKLIFLSHCKIIVYSLIKEILLSKVDVAVKFVFIKAQLSYQFTSAMQDRGYFMIIDYRMTL